MRTLPALPLLSALALVACSDDIPPPPGELLRSELERETINDLPADQRSALIAGTTDFTLALHGQLKATPGNLFISPHSITTAFTMLYAGARTETETEMALALRYGLPQDQLHTGLNWLSQQLDAREDVTLRIGNAVFAQPGLDIETPYLDVLARHYGAGVSLLDFTSQAEKSRTEINEWINDVTKDRIPELLPPNAIDAATVMVLVNALYFYGSWKFAFEDAGVGKFQAPDGEVDMKQMSVDERLGYADVDGVDVVAIPYDGEQLEMVIVMPPKGALPDFEARLDRARIDTLLGAIAPRTIHLFMPKFEIRTKLALGETMSDLGMKAAFNREKADFSGIHAEGGLYVQRAFHEAWLKVDEEGTEAAAATAVVVGLTSVAPDSQLHVDHPFLFLIRDRPTGEILFMGRVLDPR